MYTKDAGSFMYTRTIAKRLNNILPHFAVIMLIGPKYVGKSSLLERFIPNQAHKVNLNNLQERSRATNDPETFIQNHPTPLLIKEAQNAPNLLPYIKKVITQNKTKKGLYLLTCSTTTNFIEKVTNVLEGNVAILNLSGLSQYENQHIPYTQSFLQDDEYIEYFRTNRPPQKTVDSLYTNIWNGSFPELWDKKCANRNTFYRKLIKSFINEDLQEILKVSNISTFSNFLKILASQTGQSPNYTEIARKLNKSDQTIRRWIKALEVSRLIYFLKPFNINNDIILKSSKLYFSDTGVCSYLAGWETPKALATGDMNYSILENYVLTEILKSYWHNTKNLNISYYKDKKKRAINFILQTPSGNYPITIKNTDLLTTRYVKQFNPLQTLNLNIKKNIILSFKPEISHLTENTLSIPIWYI